MTGDNKFTRFIRNAGPERFFIPAGIILLVFGIISFGFHTDKYEETVGKVTSVTAIEMTFTEENSQQEYDVEVSYTVAGKEYETVFSSFTGEYNAGEEIKVYYDPENPENTSNTKFGVFFAPLITALGGIALAFGIYKAVITFKTGKSAE